MSISMKNMLIGLRPKGFWGYFGVAITMLIAVASAYQMIFHPYTVVPTADLQELVNAFFSQRMMLFELLQKCNVS